MLDVSSQLPVGSYNTNEVTNSSSVTPQRDDTFSKVGGTVSSMVAGGAASYKFSATFSSSLKNTIANVKATEGGFGDKVKATMPGVKSMGMTTLKAGGVGALVSGVVSAVTNGIEVVQGKKTGADAVGTLVADTANGTVSAMAGVTAGGLATFALSSMLGATPLMIVGVGIGALAATATSKLFKSTGAYDGIRNGIMSTTSQG
jgi:hypothetical protein